MWSSEMWWIILLIVIVAIAGIARMLGVAAGRRPEVDDASRDQVIAQLRTFSNQRPGKDEPVWDGTKRAPVPGDPGSGAIS